MVLHDRGLSSFRVFLFALGFAAAGLARLWLLLITNELLLLGFFQLLDLAIRSSLLNSLAKLIESNSGPSQAAERSERIIINLKEPCVI